MDDETAQARVLEAADRLFYDHGVRGVGMDQVRDLSGISLKRLYRLFPSKERLVETVLRRRDVAFRESLDAYVAAAQAGPPRLLAVFDYLYEWFAEPDYRGCPFINAYSELGSTSDDVTTAVTDQKAAFQATLTRLADDAGHTPGLAAQVFILANGAMVAAAIQGSPEPARQAREAVETLLAAA